MTATGMSKLTMENIRCFSKETIELRPLTILLGENSTGKTTTLGCHQTTLSILGKPDKECNDMPFNQKPHEMGKYTNIVRNPIPKSKTLSKTNREIVLTHQLNGLECKSWYVKNPQGYAEINKIVFKNPEVKKFSLELQMTNEPFLKVENWNGANKISVKIPRDLVVHNDLIDYLGASVLPHIQKIAVNGASRQPAIVKEIINNISNALPEDGLVTIPARKPWLKRFYEYVEEQSPQQDDEIPRLLYELWKKKKNTYDELISRINEFGKKTNAFEEFAIKTNNDNSKEYELTIVRDGRRMNILDMGSGVWPALVQLLIVEVETMQNRTRYFHLQHLEERSHPRLHAEFIKWLCKKINEGNKFIVETHSDYALMRLTIEICRKRINTDEVAIAYFEHVNQKKGCKIHNLRLKEDGTIVDPPHCYHRFYLDETRKYISASPRP